MVLAIKTSFCDSTGYIRACITQGWDPHLLKVIKRIKSPSEKAKTLEEIVKLVGRNIEQAAWS